MCDSVNFAKARISRGASWKPSDTRHGPHDRTSRRLHERDGPRKPGSGTAERGNITMIDNNRSCSGKHVPALLIVLLLAPLRALIADDTPVRSGRAERTEINRIWLGHRSHDPDKLVVNWMTKQPGDSIVRFGRTADYGREVRVAKNATIHRTLIGVDTHHKKPFLLYLSHAAPHFLIRAGTIATRSSRRRPGRGNRETVKLTFPWSRAWIAESQVAVLHSGYSAEESWGSSAIIARSRPAIC